MWIPWVFSSLWSIKSYAIGDKNILIVDGPENIGGSFAVTAFSVDNRLCFHFITLLPE